MPGRQSPEAFATTKHSRSWTENEREWALCAALDGSLAQDHAPALVIRMLLSE